jgi:hypothetical protein
MKFRKTVKGQIVFAILANWVAEKLAKSGMTLPEWQALSYRLSAIGISKRSAIAELKPLIPLAHEWYNDHGDSRSRGRYATWEDYWTVLFNRLFYFFHRHNESGQGRLVPGIAEWPGKVSEDGLSLVPPPIPQGTADEPEDDRPAPPPGTGYPEDDMPAPAPGTGYPEDDMPAPAPGAGYPEDASGHPEPRDTLAPASRGEEVSPYGQD